MAWIFSSSIFHGREHAYREHVNWKEERQGQRAWLTWSGVRGLPGVGHVERRLLDQRRGVHAPPDEEAGSTAEEHAHHQEEPGREHRVRPQAEARADGRAPWLVLPDHLPPGRARWSTPGRQLACRALGGPGWRPLMLRSSRSELSASKAPNGRWLQRAGAITFLTSTRYFSQNGRCLFNPVWTLLLVFTVYFPHFSLLSKQEE